VIVRVTRAKIQPHAEAEVFRILRDVSNSSPRPPGMEALLIGRRMSDGGNEFIAIGVWTDLDALQATLSGSWREPRVIPQLQPYLEQMTVEHFETVVEQFENLKTLGT